jgi:hypothetical protein
VIREFRNQNFWYSVSDPEPTFNTVNQDYDEPR